MVNKRVNLAPFVLWSAALILADQITKAIARANMAEGEFITIIPHVLDFTLVFNQGIAFGMLQGLGKWLAPVAIIMTGFAYWLYTKREPNDKMQALVAILVAGGAIGNVIDRLTMGRVTDFINIKIIPVFNFADIYITISFVVMAILIMRQEPKPDSEPTETS